MSSFQISKARLKQIIREEVEKLDAETVDNRQDSIEEARFSEYGKIDAEMGNPPSKIGQGDEEYMKAYNAVLVAKGEEPLPIVKPDQKYLDALQSGNMKPSDHSYNEAKQKSTKKYDDNPKLKGDQDELPDSLQKAIIKKAGGDAEEEEEKEKNENLDLEAMIRQEILAALNGA